MINEYVKDRVIDEAYDGDASKFLLERFEFIYEDLLNSIKDEDFEEVLSYILKREKNLYKKIRVLDDCSTLTLFSEYSSLAFDLAQERCNTKQIPVLATYFFSIFNAFFESYKQSIQKEQGWIISDTIVDVGYAAGKTDCMSFRLYDTTL